jgi:hypothetical protein
VLCHVDAID